MTQRSSNFPPSETLPDEESVNGTHKSYPSAELIQHTIRVWEPRLGRPLTEEDARQILQNVVGAFKVLNGWKNNQSDREADENHGNGDP